MDSKMYIRSETNLKADMIIFTKEELKFIYNIAGKEKPIKKRDIDDFKILFQNHDDSIEVIITNNSCIRLYKEKSELSGHSTGSYLYTYREIGEILKEKTDTYGVSFYEISALNGDGSIKKSITKTIESLTSIYIKDSRRLIDKFNNDIPEFRTFIQKQSIETISELIPYCSKEWKTDLKFVTIDRKYGAIASDGYRIGTRGSNLIKISINSLEDLYFHMDTLKVLKSLTAKTDCGINIDVRKRTIAYFGTLPNFDFNFEVISWAENSKPSNPAGYLLDEYPNTISFNGIHMKEILDALSVKDKKSCWCDRVNLELHQDKVFVYKDSTRIPLQVTKIPSPSYIQPSFEDGLTFTLNESYFKDSIKNSLDCSLNFKDNVSMIRLKNKNGADFLLPLRNIS